MTAPAANPVRRVPSVVRSANDMPAMEGGSPLPVLASSALLQGQNAVLIEHLGQHYRLQATRQGKLILTK